MSKQSAIDLIKSTQTMNRHDLYELGEKVSLSMFPDKVKSIIFRAIDLRKDELINEADAQGVDVVCSEFDGDDIDG